MGLLVACKNEEDSIKNVGARVVTTLFIDFSDTQGQLTPKLCLFVCIVALRPKSTAMVIAGRSVHLTTPFPGQA